MVLVIDENEAEVVAILEDPLVHLLDRNHVR